MKRLTAQFGKNHAVPTNFNLDFAWDMSNTEWQGLTYILDLLSAYEDTGITPSEIDDLHSELCLKCGKYHDAHLGACDWCRWKR